MNKWIRIIIFTLLPLAVVIAAFIYYIWLGVIIVVIWTGIAVYQNRFILYATKANAAHSKGQYDECIQWLEKAAKVPGCQRKYIITLGYLYLKHGEVEKAESIFESMLKQRLTHPEQMDIQSNMALMMWKKGNLDGAIALMEETFQKYKTTNVYGSLGYLYILAGDLDKALAFNQEAYDYNDSNAVILDNLGQTYVLQGNLDQALDIYTKLMGLSPVFPEAYYYYGMVLLGQGKRAEALKQFELALDKRFTYLTTVNKEQIEEEILKLGDQVHTSE